jgi:HK97 family phage major capsid protein
METNLTSLLRRRADAQHQYRNAIDSGDDVAASFRKLTLDELTSDIRRSVGPEFDIEFRQLLATRRAYEAPFETRALGATARATLGIGDTFVTTLSGAMANVAPLLDLATVVTTETGEDLDFSYVATLPTPNGIVADGASITAADPTFAGGSIKAFAYKDLIEISNELLSDGTWPVEQWAANRMGPSIAYKLSADLWNGAGPTTAPQGLLGGLSTVNAAGAAIVTFDDVAALLNAVPAAYRYSGRTTILLSPGAHIDLLEEQPLHPGWANGTIHGFNFRVDPQLADPATTTKSVVAGDFETAFMIRLVPLRIQLDKSVHFGTDKSSLRVVLRADSLRMITGAAKALVHP